MAVDEPMAIIIGVLIVGQQEGGNVWLFFFFYLYSHRYYSNCKTRFTCWWLGLSVRGENDRPTTTYRKKNGRITGSERGPLDCCCCFLLFSLLLGLHLLLSISQTSCTPVEQSSWIDYQRGYLNLGRQITRPQSQNHHHHQTFFFPLLFFLFIYPKINRKIDKKGLFNLASFINIFWY